MLRTFQAPEGPTFNSLGMNGARRSPEGADQKNRNCIRRSDLCRLGLWKMNFFGCEVRDSNCMTPCLIVAVFYQPILVSPFGAGMRVLCSLVIDIRPLRGLAKSNPLTIEFLPFQQS